MPLPIELCPVESSALVAVGYDPAQMTLYVEFHQGMVYAYSCVPPEVHTALLRADSLGGYLEGTIKRSNYPFKRVR